MRKEMVKVKRQNFCYTIFMVQKLKILMTMYSNVIPQWSASQTLSGIKNTYITKLDEFKVLPIFASGHMNKSTIDDLYDLCDGVLVPGGKDLNPKLYGQEAHPKTGMLDLKTDDLDLYLINKTLNDGKPFLGICRGAQALAVACGGTLIQHLPDVTEETHGASEEKSSDKVFENPHHSVIIDRKSKTYGVIKKDRITVISRHHQAIDNPGSLHVSGKSPGGIIEFVEHPSLPYHLGIQGHPELDNSLDMLFESLFEASLTAQAKMHSKNTLFVNQDKN